MWRYFDVKSLFEVPVLGKGYCAHAFSCCMVYLSDSHILFFYFKSTSLSGHSGVKNTVLKPPLCPRYAPAMHRSPRPQGVVAANDWCIITMTGYTSLLPYDGLAYNTVNYLSQLLPTSTVAHWRFYRVEKFNYL